MSGAPGVSRPLLLSAAFLLFGLSTCLFAESKALRQQAEALWTKAEAVSKPDYRKMTPYHQEASFTLSHLSAGELHGTYRKEFADANNWLEEVRIGPYQKYSIRKNGKLYSHENADFTPRGVSQVIRALTATNIRPEQGQSVHKVRSESLDGKAAICVETTSSAGDIGKGETCVSEGDGVLLKETSWEQTTLYSNYKPFEDKLLATHVEALYRGAKTMSADVAYRERPDLVAASILVPAAAQPELECKQKTPPKLQFHPDPSFPEGPNRPERALVGIDVRIGSDGRVKTGRISQSAGPDFDEAALGVVRTWTFKPSLCDLVPVEVTIHVDVDFHR
jgi:TonB family protein